MPENKSLIDAAREAVREHLQVSDETPDNHRDIGDWPAFVATFTEQQIALAVAEERKRVIDAVIKVLCHQCYVVVPRDRDISDYPFDAVPKSLVLGLKTLVDIELAKEIGGTDEQ